MKIIDGYPEYMMKSIKQVEKKRERNMSEPVKPMSMKDRETMLETLNQLCNLGVFPAAKPTTITESSEQEYETAAHGGSVIYLKRHSAHVISDAPAVNRNSDAERRTGQDRRKLKLPANVVEIKFGEERRNAQDRRSGQERRAAVGE